MFLYLNTSLFWMLDEKYTLGEGYSKKFHNVFKELLYRRHSLKTKDQQPEEGQSFVSEAPQCPNFSSSYYYQQELQCQVHKLKQESFLCLFEKVMTSFLAFYFSKVVILLIVVECVLSNTLFNGLYMVMLCGLMFFNDQFIDARQAQSLACVLRVFLMPIFMIDLLVTLIVQMPVLSFDFKDDSVVKLMLQANKFHMIGLDSSQRYATLTWINSERHGNFHLKYFIFVCFSMQIKNIKTRKLTDLPQQI